MPAVYLHIIIFLKCVCDVLTIWEEGITPLRRNLCRSSYEPDLCPTIYEFTYVITEVLGTVLRKEYANQKILTRFLSPNNTTRYR